MEGLNPVVGWGALVAAIVGPILTWLVARKKVAIEESSEVFSRWKELTDAMKDMAKTHQDDMKALRAELRAEREENETLRERVRTLEDEISTIKRNQKLEREGFVRQITQLQTSLQTHGIILPVPPNKNPPPEEGNRTAQDLLRELGWNSDEDQAGRKRGNE